MHAQILVNLRREWTSTTLQITLQITLYGKAKPIAANSGTEQYP